MDDIPQFPSAPAPLASEFKETLAQIEKQRDVARLQSAAARTNFNEKLAVLVAGSLALLGTFAVTLYNKPLSSAEANHQTFKALALGALCLWLSLCLGVFHNLADSPLYGQEAEMYLAQVLALVQVRRHIESASALDEVAIAHEKWDRMYERSKRRRKLQERMSLVAFALFAAGYSQILYVVIQLSRGAW